MSAGEKEEPRLVQIGFNLISLLDVNDKEHSFQGNVLTHVWWDAAPLTPNKPFFRPWIQMHNIKSVEEILNEGMEQWSRHELIEKVHAAEKDWKARGSPGKFTCPVMESRNFVGTFVSTLNLRSFPFDQQTLRITVMCNMTKDVTFSHKVARDAVTKVANPAKDTKGRVICAIKCNLEADTLSEWDVLLQDGKRMDQGIKIGSPAPAVVRYEFIEHDKAFSAEGNVYQRMDFYVCVERELKNMMFTIVVPTTMLSMSSLSVFSMDVVEAPGDRFSVLFTLLLTIIANQFVTQGRLPYLAYFTWLDACMFGLQLFVYAVIVETATVTSIAPLLEMSEHDCDLIALWVLIGTFGFMLLVGGGSGYWLWRMRKQSMAAAEAKGRDSFDDEEKRLMKLWGKTVDDDSNNEIVISTNPH